MSLFPFSFSIKSGIGLAAFAVVATLSAASWADPACDSAFMSKMKERAWMEAQREMMLNEKYIWKPDSVLALSCFVGQLDAVPITFSCIEGVGGSGTACHPTGQKVLKNVKNNATKLASSISPYMLGGGNTSTAADPSKAPSSCDSMNQLWNKARCINADLASDFPTFTDLSSNDIRTVPSTCGSKGDWSTPTSDMNAVGLNMGTGKFDSINLFLNVTAPLSTLSGGSCFDGIPTGVKVGGSSGFNEVVCPNPGCSPTKSGGTAKCEKTP